MAHCYEILCNFDSVCDCYSAMRCAVMQCNGMKVLKSPHRNVVACVSTFICKTPNNLLNNTQKNDDEVERTANQVWKKMQNDNAKKITNDNKIRQTPATDNSQTLARARAHTQTIAITTTATQPTRQVRLTRTKINGISQ